MLALYLDRVLNKQYGREKSGRARSQLAPVILLLGVVAAGGSTEAHETTTHPLFSPHLLEMSISSLSHKTPLRCASFLMMQCLILGTPSSLCRPRPVMNTYLVRIVARNAASRRI